MARTRRSLYSALAILLFVVAALLQQAHGQGFGSPGMEDEPPPEEGQEPPSTDSQDAPPEDPPSPPPSPPPARPPRRFPPPPSPFPPPPPLQSFASRTQAIVAYLQPFSSRNGLEACNTRAKQMSENTFAVSRAGLRSDAHQMRPPGASRARPRSGEIDAIQRSTATPLAQIWPQRARSGRLVSTCRTPFAVTNPPGLVEPSAEPAFSAIWWCVRAVLQGQPAALLPRHDRGEDHPGQALERLVHHHHAAG